MLYASPPPHSSLMPFPSSAAIDLPSIEYRGLLSIKIEAQTTVSSAMWSFCIVLWHPPPKVAAAFSTNATLARLWNGRNTLRVRSWRSRTGPLGRRCLWRGRPKVPQPNSSSKRGGRGSGSPPRAIWEGSRERPEYGMVSARLDPHES